MKKGGHEHVFCSEMQFGEWYTQLRKVTETVEKFGLEEDALLDKRIV